MRIHLPAIGPDLPVHPRTGLTAIGLRRNGAPIWPVLGGAPDDDEADDGDQGDDDAGGVAQGDGDKPDDLGDAGKQAIDRMKAQVKKTRADLRPWTGLAREFGVSTADEVRNLLKGKKADGGDAPDPDQIRREVRAEVERETAKGRLLDKIEAKAGKFADPEDAAALLLRENDIDEFLDGTQVDSAAITEALDELLTRKPYLAAKSGGAAGERRPPKKDPSQGSRGGKALSARERAMEQIAKRFPASTTT